jgi:hypothetical protein
MPRISEYPLASSINGNEELVANQSGTTRKLTITQVRSTLQPLNDDLTAFAGNSTNGFWAKTGPGTGVARSIAGSGMISIINPDGVSGNPTISISQNGATIGQVIAWDGSQWAPSSAGASTTFLALTDTPSSYASQGLNFVRVNSGATSLEFITPANVLTAIGAQPADTTLTAFAGLTSGIPAVTSPNTVAQRTITSGAGIVVTNGDGVNGNPTVALAGPQAVQAAISPIVTISANTTLTNSTHAGRTLVCTAAVTLTVNASTSFANVGDTCTIYADGGDVTVVATGATVNVPSGDTLVIAANGSGFLRRLTAANTYALNGTLVAV